MRIPTSVIVMSLVTAAPFALAVRDTLHPQPKHHTYEEIAAHARSEQYKAELKRMEEERQAEDAHKQAVLKDLLGDKGKLGSYVDGVTVGATRDQIDAINLRISGAGDLVYLAPEYDATDKASSIKVVFTDCDALREAVRARWDDANQWVDPATHVKMTFEDGYECSLDLHRYVEMEQFLDKTTTASIPIGAIGKPSTLPLDGDQTMQTPGLEHTGDVVVGARTDDSGKVLGLSVSFAADVDADAPIRARLDTLFGKGQQDPDTGEWFWKGKTPVHYAFSDAHVYIDIGQP
jgi:hypothetical protein